jgi:hypothetical protein
MTDIAKQEPAKAAPKPAAPAFNFKSAVDSQLKSLKATKLYKERDLVGHSEAHTTIIRRVQLLEDLQDIFT